MTDPASIDRTRDHVAREYGQEKWPAMERKIQELREAEPDACLSRILTQVATSQYRPGDTMEPRRFVLDGEQARMPAGGGFGAAQFILQDHITHALERDTDLVMELGSGWGWRILSTWPGGGPQDALYVAAEYTPAGRRAAAALAELDPRLDFRAIPVRLPRARSGRRRRARARRGLHRPQHRADPRGPA